MSDKYPEGPSAGDWWEVLGDREPDENALGYGDYPIMLNIFNLSNEEVSRLTGDDDEWDNPEDRGGVTTAQHYHIDPVRGFGHW